MTVKRVSIWKESRVWVVRVDSCDGSEEFAARSLITAFAKAEAAHGPLLIDYIYQPKPLKEAA